MKENPMKRKIILSVLVMAAGLAGVCASAYARGEADELNDAIRSRADFRTDAPRQKEAEPLFSKFSGMFQSSPEEAYAQIVRSSAQGDWGAVYDSFDESTRRWIGEFYAGWGLSDEETAGRPVRELFIQNTQNAAQGGRFKALFDPDYKIRSVRMEGDRKAVLTVEQSRVWVTTVVMVLEGGQWKLQYDNDMQRNLEAANTALAKSILRSLSTAAETYATANVGVYPSSINDLLFAEPPYLNTNFCVQVQSGYRYECGFTRTGYRIRAISVQGGQEYSISTGGIFSP